MAFGIISLWENRSVVQKCRMREGSKEEGTGDEEMRLPGLVNMDIEAAIPKLVLFISYSSTNLLLPLSAHPTFFLLASRFITCMKF